MFNSSQIFKTSFIDCFPLSTIKCLKYDQSYDKWIISDTLTDSDGNVYRPSEQYYYLYNNNDNQSTQIWKQF